jgi:aspartate racemase
MAEAGRRLVAAGADGLVICSNTMHRMAEAVEDAAGVSLLHIADATADRLLERGARRPALLATRYTMEQDFYRGRLEARGLDVRVPDAAGRACVHAVIYEELCRGIVREESRAAYRAVVAAMADAGADSLILGCTEIGCSSAPRTWRCRLGHVYRRAAVTSAMSSSRCEPAHTETPRTHESARVGTQ